MDTLGVIWIGREASRTGWDDLLFEVFFERSLCAVFQHQVQRILSIECF